MGLFRKGKFEVTMSLFDYKLVAICGLFVGFILVKLIPAIMDVSLWWWEVLAALCLIRVYKVIFFSK